VAIWIDLLDVSPQPLLPEKISHVATEPISKNQKLRPSASPRQKIATVSPSPSNKKSKIFFPWVAMLLLVLGYFLQGIVLGNYPGALTWVLASTLTWALAFAWALAGVWAWIFAVIWAGAGAFSFSFAWLEMNDWIDDRQGRWFPITTLGGALLGGGFSGYATSSGIIWGLFYGLFAWAILLGYAGSEYRLKKNYSYIQVFLIYGIFSSIGLISGGMLGSWLKVAGIIKLP
jgi:hypothetical protein